MDCERLCIPNVAYPCSNPTRKCIYVSFLFVWVYTPLFKNESHFGEHSLPFLVKMEFAIKSTIATAFGSLKSKYPNAEEVCADLLTLLFPEGSVSVPVVPASPVKEKKPRAPRAKKAEKKDEVIVKKEEAPVEEKAEETPVEEKKEETPAPEPEKKAKKPAGPKPKKEDKPKQNLDKLSAPQTKKFKAVCDELKIEGDKKADFLAYVNGLAKDVYDATKLEEHMRTFLTPAPVEAPAPEEKEEGEVEGKEMDVVEFEGVEYGVDEGKVYTFEGEFLGYIGAGKFAGMKIPA